MAVPTDVFSGARARFKVDSNVIGFAGGVSGSESVDYEPVDVINLLEVREFVTTAYRATLNAQIFRVIGSSVKALGLLPANPEVGGSPGNPQGVLGSPDLECSIEDRVTGENMATFLGCRLQEHSFDVTARGIVSENVTFVTIKLRDEFENPASGG